MRIEVEARERHDDVVQSVLDREEDFGGSVKFHYPVVVGRVEGIQKGGANCEERNVLDIGIVSWMIRNN